MVASCFGTDSCVSGLDCFFGTNEKSNGKGTYDLVQDNIKMDLQEVGWKGVDNIHVAQDRNRWWAVVNTVMKLRVS